MKKKNLGTKILKNKKETEFWFRFQLQSLIF